MTARELVDLAEATLRSDVAGAAWPKAVALLARQGLEAAVDELWLALNLDMTRCSNHAQLLCLTHYLGDEQAAETAAATWNALSRVCHHHPYELAPTAEELSGWLAGCRTVLAAVQRRAAPAR